MPRPDEGLIHTWLDGECTPEESARIEALVTSDPAWAAAVAEARGLVAASSRIIGALDAVPGGVVPKPASEPRAKPTHTGSRGFRVRPWMGIAAGLVLVAGTAVVLREKAQDAFSPQATVDVTVRAEAADSDASAGAVADAIATETSTPPPATQSQARTGIVGVAEPAAGQGATGQGATGQSALGGNAERARAEAAVAVEERASDLAAEAAAARVAAREAEIGERRALAAIRPTTVSAAPRVAATQAATTPQLAAAPPARAPAAFADAAKAVAPIVLTGCWRVSAPPEFLGLLHNPPIQRIAGDTLVLQVNVERFVTVTRAGDTLSGELAATRETCPPTP